MLYLAYGADTSAAWMAQACLAARAAGSLSLIGWRLEFRQVENTVYATLTRSKESRVPCVLWDMPDECCEALGEICGFPAMVRRELVELPSGAAAMVYLSNGGELCQPTRTLADGIRAGYEDFGINPRYLNEAIRRAERRVGLR